MALRRRPGRVVSGGAYVLPLASAVFLVLELALAGLLLSACAAPPLFPAVLGPPVAGMQVTHRVRRPPYKPYVERTMAYNEMPPAKTDWAARLAELPKDATGATDWVRALNDKLIDPKPGIDAKAEAQPELDMDVELVPKDAPDMKATYPHKIHTQLLACDNCHTGIFQMERGADPITMEKIFAGEYCGRCHGKVAFDVASGCPRCHLGMPK